MKMMLGVRAALLLWTQLHAQEPELKVDLGNGVSMDLVLVHAGTFIQGSPGYEAGRGDDEAQRKVTLTKDYYIGKTAVTRAQWERFVTDTRYRTEAESGPSGGFGWDGSKMTQRRDFTWRNPGFPQDGNHPVTIVTVPDAEAFCKWLQKRAGRQVTLPTEAQWEFACRAGTTGAWHNNGTLQNCGEIAWHNGNAGNATHPVTNSKPNPWGLHIGGNVSEWCADFYAPYEVNLLTDPLQTNPNLSDKPRKVLRGGSWARDPKNTRSAARFRADARSRNADTGFRVVCSVGTLASGTSSVASVPPMTLPRMKPDEQTPNSAPLPSSHTESVAPTQGRTINLSISGLICFLVPVIIVITLVVRVFKKVVGTGSSSSTNARAIGAGIGMASSPFGQRGPSSFAGQGVRLGDDGFWLMLNAARGTRIRYTYRPEGGMDVTDEVVYEPGGDGQFIYTGTKPESVRILDAGGDIDVNQLSTGSMYDQGPGANIPPPMPGFGSSQGSSRRSSSSSGSRYPSAY